jgi:hypothetical protein
MLKYSVEGEEERERGNGVGFIKEPRNLMHKQLPSKDDWILELLCKQSNSSTAAALSDRDFCDHTIGIAHYVDSV